MFIINLTLNYRLEVLGSVVLTNQTWSSTEVLKPMGKGKEQWRTINWKCYDLSCSIRIDYRQKSTRAENKSLKKRFIIMFKFASAKPSQELSV